MEKKEIKYTAVLRGNSVIVSDANGEKTTGSLKGEK